MKRNHLLQRMVYSLFRVSARTTGLLFCNLRIQGAEHWPAESGALVCSNHQSYLDPVLVGLTCPRQLNYLARKSLFDIPVLAPLIQMLNAIPVDRQGSGIAGLKQTLKRLKQQELVLIFPEGTRTKDGSISRLKPGFIPVARKAKVPLIPVGIAGAYEAWPRSQKFPWPHPISIVIGKPIETQEIDSAADEELLNLLQTKIELAYSQAKNKF